MEQLLTANVANNLYWFGRYLERVESTLIEVVYHFDRIIDIDNPIRDDNMYLFEFRKNHNKLKFFNQK